MSSGFGLNGGRGRCFTFWQDLQKCYVSCEDEAEKCRIYYEDYQECITHLKEVSWNEFLNKEI